MGGGRGVVLHPPLAFIGCGRAGGTLAVLLAASGWPVAALWSRRRARALTVARRVAAASTPASSPPSCANKFQDTCGPVTLLAVPDREIATIAARLPPPPRAPGVLLHLSGAAPATVLAAARRRGWSVGSLHPLAVLGNDRPLPGQLDGAGFAVDGDAGALRLARRLARRLGGQVFAVKGKQRGYYHLAAALVANDTVGLFALALERARRAGIPPQLARASLARLLAQVAAELTHKEPEEMLTGPVARGDAATLQAHLRAAGGSLPRRVHGDLSRLLIDVALSGGRLRPSQARTLRHVLGHPSQSPAWTQRPPAPLSPSRIRRMRSDSNSSPASRKRRAERS